MPWCNSTEPWAVAGSNRISSKRSLRPAQGLSLSKASVSKSSNRWSTTSFAEREEI
jgi:hypothetical protein